MDKGDGRFVPQFKIHSVQCWNLTGHLVSMSVQDYTDSASAKKGEDQLAGLVDTGSPGLLPKVGFRMPASQRNHVVRNDDQESQVTIVAMQVGPQDQGLAYITLEYRFDGSTTLPTSDNLFSVLTRCYRAVSVMKARTGSIAETSEKTFLTAEHILQAMPSAEEELSSACNQSTSNQGEATTTTTPPHYEDLLRVINDFRSRLSLLESATSSVVDFDTLP